MKNLRYVGSSDIRELSPEDLRKLGVEDAEATLSFRKGESLTVDDKVAEAILNQVNDMREATDEELVEEEEQLEAELGFQLYNPSEHTVKEVSDELGHSDDTRRQYILDQERANKNRKGIFEAVGAEYDPKANEATGEDPLDELPLDDATAEAMEAAGGRESGVAATPTTGGGTTGGGTTAPGGGTGGPANTSSSA